MSTETCSTKPHELTPKVVGVDLSGFVDRPSSRSCWRRLRRCDFVFVRLSVSLVFLVFLVIGAPASFAQVKPDKDYLVYVLSEAADTISLIRFGPGGARVDHEVPTGDMPIDIDGPH